MPIPQLCTASVAPAQAIGSSYYASDECAEPIRVPRELLEDSAIDLQDLLIRQVADAEERREYPPGSMYRALPETTRRRLTAGGTRPQRGA